jgi:hypothetical protein
MFNEVVLRQRESWHSARGRVVLRMLTVFPCIGALARYMIDGAKYRPIVVDSSRNRAKFELRKFLFEIISEKF